MPDLWSSEKILNGESHVQAIRLGTIAVAPLLRWPVEVLDAPGTIDRSSFALLEQRLGSDLATLSTMTNEMTSDPDDVQWGWFSGGWSRPGSATMPLNARAQESVVTLAWFYTQQRSWNPYYQDTKTFDRLLAGLRYYLQLQREDGGFTENTVDTSELAPTTFALDRLGWTYMLLTSANVAVPEWTDYWQERVRSALISAATWFLNETNNAVWLNGTNYSNQVFAGLVGCIHIQSILPSTLQTQFTSALDRVVERGESAAGHVYEHYGVDFSYTAEVALPDLGYIYEKTNHAGIAELVQKDIDFMTYNFLLEPDGRGYTVNGAVATRTPTTFFEYARDDMESRFDLMSSLRAIAPQAGAFLTTASDKANARTTWANNAAAVPMHARGAFRSYRIHAITRPENLPTTTQKNAAIQTLPYFAQLAFTVLREDTRGGATAIRYNRHYLYVKRPGYYIGAYFGYRSDQTRSGLNFLYHPNLGAVITSQPDGTTTWGLQKTDYSDGASTLSSSTTVPTGTGNFSFQLSNEDSSSARTIAFAQNDFTVNVTGTGSFFERIPLVIWPAINAQVADEITMTLAAGGTQNVTGGAFNGSVTAITIVRANRGQTTITFPQARTVTLSDFVPEALTIFTPATRKIRHLDISASGSLSYTVAITIV